MIYRTLEELPPRPNHSDPAALKGQLVYGWQASQPKLEFGQVAVTTQPNGWGGMIIVARERLEANPAPHWPDFPELIKYYMRGTPPNLELGTAETLERDLDNIACSAGMGVHPEICHITLPGQTSSRWARAFLSFTQGGKLDGTGMLLIYRGYNGDKAPRTARFAICKHEKKIGGGASPSRGWHPGRCAKCDLDMTVDSGD